MTRFVYLVPILVMAACGGGSTSDDAGRDAGGIDGAPAPDAPGADAPHCRDDDGDGHGAVSCGGDDCDDADPHRYPTNTELCDSIDQDCNPATLGPDSDGDGEPSTACCNPTSGGPPTCGLDCDDTRATVNATALETCNGADDNCNGMIDEGVPMSLCYADADMDGYALPSASSHMACSCLSNETSLAPASPATSDCNDTSAMVHPTAVDICDGLDNDCNGMIDDGAGAAYYQDCDADGYGDLTMSRLGCTVPTVATSCAGGVWVARPFDCDDTRASVHPGASETCNLRDDDCNGMVDDVTAATVATDTANCGACGHACRHPGCSAGLCTDDYSDVRAGYDHACGLRHSGSVYCWGGNSNGQLGDGTLTTRTTPVAVSGLTDAVAIDVGRGLSCALRRTGGVSCWGLERDSSFSPRTPADVGGYTDARAIDVDSTTATGSLHQVVTVLHGDTVTLHDFAASSVRSTSGAAAATTVSTVDQFGTPTPCLVLSTGAATCGGTAVVGVTTARLIRCGDSTCTVVLADGTLASWSLMSSGGWTDAMPTAATIGDATWISRQALLVVRATGDVVYQDGSTAVAIHDAVRAEYCEPDAFNTFGCAVRRDDSVACWGSNNVGQLGDGSATAFSSTPVTVSGS